MKSLSVSIPESQLNLEPKADDEQLNELLDTPSSLSSSIYETCRCCGETDCENLGLIKKLESDTRLAAEIGQSLLDKHENYVKESNQQRSLLKKQLEECQEKVQALESTLDNVENDKADIMKEKNKWHWEYQKRQKILDETVSDLESANDKCSQLSNELRTKENELEKLRIFKFMARHSESREETLISKLEDTNQELAICRKHELLLESKIKKLKSKYENLCNSHEKLLGDFEDRMKSALIINNHRTNTAHSTIKNNSNENNTNDLIDVIKELSLANTKLKLDLMNCKDQLTEAKGEINALNQKVEDMNEPAPQNTLSSLIKTPTRAHTIQNPPMPTISSSMPTSSFSENDPSAVHHHFHYYTKNNKGEYIQITDEMDTKSSDGEHSKDESILLSPTKSTFFNTKDGTTTTTTAPRSPFMILLEHATQVLERLRGSDIRALNRRLKRAFDITELSSMSNSIIDNIVMELDTLESRFIWVNPKNDDRELMAFFPLLNLLKDILKELGMMKSTMNELQVEYVKKVEESEVRVEEEIIRKRQLKKQATMTVDVESQSPLLAAKPLAWITNMFSKTQDDKILVQSPEENEPHFLRPSQYVRTVDHLRRQPVMSKSSSTGTSRSIPIQNNRRSPHHRINIDYEGIGPASIRPIPSERDSGPEFSSSWLGGK